MGGSLRDGREWLHSLSATCPAVTQLDQAEAMRLTIPILLSANAGYVDTAGFLTLHGLFPAHITGNFVTLGMALTSGASGVWAKILALPVFCLIVFASRILASSLPRMGLPVMRTLLILKVLLLVAAAWMAVAVGGSEAHVIITGLLLVSAMALQNAISRIYSNHVPATMLTGPLTQLMIDVADLVRGLPPSERAAVKSRLARTAATVASFAVGCGFGAILLREVGTWCFIAPPVLAFMATMMGETRQAHVAA